MALVTLRQQQDCSTLIQTFVSNGLYPLQDLVVPYGIVTNVGASIHLVPHYLMSMKARLAPNGSDKASDRGRQGTPGKLWCHCRPLLVQTLFIPQTPLAAPGPTLLDQMLYPQLQSATLDVNFAHLEGLLQQVKLHHLLLRAQGHWTLPQNWAGKASKPSSMSLLVHSCLS